MFTICPDMNLMSVCLQTEHPGRTCAPIALTTHAPSSASWYPNVPSNSLLFILSKSNIWFWVCAWAEESWVTEKEKCSPHTGLQLQGHVPLQWCGFFFLFFFFTFSFHNRGCFHCCSTFDDKTFIVKLHKCDSRKSHNDSIHFFPFVFSNTNALQSQLHNYPLATTWITV